MEYGNKPHRDIADLLNNATADKGYDSEENHRFAHREIGANSIIPLRWDIPLSRTKGFYRRKLRRNFPYNIYHQRSKIETINSVQKRKFGDELRSRLLKLQRREMKAIDVVCNIHRYINYYVSLFIGFLQSLYFFMLALYHPYSLRNIGTNFSPLAIIWSICSIE